MNRRTKGEQRAFRDGYEMCGECIEKYLTEDGKKRLNALIMSVRNAVDIEDLPDSAEGEYIKKEDAIKAFEPYRGYLSRSNDTKFVEDLKNLPTVSFPDREKGEQLYSDLLRVKHGTMNIDSLIDKVYADMRVTNV